AGADYLFADNLNSVQTYGLETNLSLNQALTDDWQLNSQLGYTLMDSYNPEETPAKYTSNYARHLLNGMLMVQNGPFKAAISGLWKKRRDDRSEAISAYKSPAYTV